MALPQYVLDAHQGISSSGSLRVSAFPDGPEKTSLAIFWPVLGDCWTAIGDLINGRAVSVNLTTLESTAQAELDRLNAISSPNAVEQSLQQLWTGTVEGIQYLVDSEAGLPPGRLRSKPNQIRSRYPTMIDRRENAPTLEIQRAYRAGMDAIAWFLSHYDGSE